MNAAVSTQCQCCKGPAGSKAVTAVAIGIVCFPCAVDLTRAAAALEAAGLRKLYIGPCPDNEPKGGQP